MRLLARLSFATLFVGLAGSVSLIHATSVTLDVSADLQYGGTLTGTLTVSSTDPSDVLGYDITASAGPGSAGFTFPGFTYDSADSVISAETSTLLQFDDYAVGDELRLVFGAPFPLTGDTITSGYESELVAGNRVIDSGSITTGTPYAATPEPSSLLLLGTGLLGALGAVRKRFV